MDCIYKLIYFVAIFILQYHACVGLKCKFPTYTSKHPGMKLILPLQDMTFPALDKVNGYLYIFGVCTNPVKPPYDTQKYTQSGMVQINVKEKKIYNLGNFTSSNIMSGNDWVMLEYTNGDKYTSHCNKQNRRVSIMILCDKDGGDPNFRIIEENTNKSDTSCYYMFELRHSVVCGNGTTFTDTFGVGSILVVIFFVTIAVYLTLGVIINRVCFRKVGMEQIPQLEKWQDFGNLVADGCDLVFRSRVRSLPIPYQPVGTGIPQTNQRRLSLDFSDDDKDDHPLPL